MARNHKPKKRTKFERQMNKLVDARMKDLYLNKDFRLKLESEAEEIKTPEDLIKYQIEAEKRSRKEAETK